MQEIVGLFAALLIAYAPLVTFDFVQPPRDLLMVIGCWPIFGWLSAAVGLVVAGLSEIFEAVDKFVDEALHGLIPLTGTFEMVDWLPQQAQTVMLHSPLVNAIEILRGSSPSSATRRNRSIPARRPARRSSWWRAWASNSPGWRRR